MEQRGDYDILYELICCDPDIVVCINRICNACLHNSWEISENGRPITDALKQKLQQVYDVFMRDCVRMMYMCGFAAFYVRRVHKIPLPFCPVIGTFTWRSVVSECKKTGSNAVYEVTLLKGGVHQRDLHIVNYYSPIISPNIKTPMQALLSQYKAVMEMHQTIRASNKWNQEKHIVVTESMDIKDQTTSGLQLLDDMRRYTLSGEHALMGDKVVRLKNRYNRELKNTNEAKMEWIHDQFGGDGRTQGIGTHILPPNMNVVELSNIVYGNEYEVLLQQYRDSVYTFFGLQNQSTVQVANKSVSEFISTEQHINTQNVINFLQNVLQLVYAESFRVDMHTVRVVIKAQARASVNSTDDIKKLSETQALAPQLKYKIGKLMDTAM